MSEHVEVFTQQEDDILHSSFIKIATFAANTLHNHSILSGFAPRGGLMENQSSRLHIEAHQELRAHLRFPLTLPSAKILNCEAPNSNCD